MLIKLQRLKKMYPFLIN